MAAAMDQKRIESIRSLLTSRLAKSDTDTVFLSTQVLINNPLLGSDPTVRRVLGIISQQTNGGISFDVIEKPLTWEQGETTANTNVTPPVFGPLVVVGYEIHITDPEKLDEYFEKLPRKRPAEVKRPRSKKKPFYGEVIVGELQACGDGLIRFNDEVVEMRPQLISLCWLFMESRGLVTTTDDIREKIIASKKRPLTSNSTIAKYVSELHMILEPLYRHPVIFNTRENGWRFEPERQT